MNLDENYKNKIGERLTKVLIDVLEAGEVSQEEASDISSYILENINNAKDNTQLFDFLTNLAKKWPIFSKVLDTEQQEISDSKKDEAVGQASDFIKENKIDEALKVVEAATENTADENKGVV